MKKTEYKVLSFNVKGFINLKSDHQAIENELNEYGAQGWELVKVLSPVCTGMLPFIQVYLKREVGEQ
ncbi:MAG: DUF4177 domain-containing protein [Clostridiales Family XIII bacterium]|nr:DUF4177 domain-containing protein [Clostridiales Family XIII bacterium]